MDGCSWYPNKMSYTWVDSNRHVQASQDSCLETRDDIMMHELVNGNQDDDWDAPLHIRDFGVE